MSFYTNSTLPEQLMEIQKYSKGSYDNFKKKHKLFACGGTKYKTKADLKQSVMKVKKTEPKVHKVKKKM